MTGRCSYSFSLIVVGDAAVGKTSIISAASRYDAYEDFGVSTLYLDGKATKLSMQEGSWDYNCQQAMGVLLVYDITNRESFNNLRSYMANEMMHAPIDIKWMILGNKCDLKARREVQQEEGEVLAAKFGIKFIETNATKRYRGAIDIAIRTLSQDIKDKMDQQRHPETLLHFAVENKSHSAAEVLIAEKKADVNAADCNGRTALMIAAENNDWKSIYLLLQAGADTTLKNKYGDTAQQCAVSKRNHIPAVLMAEKTIQSLGDTDRIIALIAAVEEFDWTSVQKFLRSGVHTTLRDERGRTALHIAIEKGSYSATEFLIATKAHLNSVNNDGRTALMIAAVAETDKSDIIRELLRAGADTTIEDKDGRTALMIAGNSNSAVALLEAGSDIEMKDKDGKTALMIAAEKNARDITIELLRAGADMTIKDRNGRSALMIASEKDNSNTAIALLKAGADTTVKDKLGYTALHIAIETKSHSAVEMLIAGMADVNSLTDDGRTALMIAVEKGDATSVQMLLKAGADTTLRNKQGHTALHIALFISKSQAAAEVLIDKKAALNSVDVHGRTVLMTAVEKEDLTSLQVLLRAGADVTLRDKHGHTALHLALFERKSQPSVKVLIAKKEALNSVDGEHRTALMTAVAKQDINSLQILLQAGADPTVKDENGHTALYNALFQIKSYSVAQILVDNKAALNAMDGDGKTALMIAAEKVDVPSLQLLLHAGADITLRDKTDRTVLHYAAELGLHDAAMLLLEKQADADVADKEGNTPLHIAAMKNSSAVVDVLLKSKAKADCLNKRGKWPCQMATNFELKRTLQEAKFAILYAAGTVTPKAMKLCVLGPPGAGKTTLVEALKRKWIKSLFTWERQRDHPDCQYERTVGINVSTVDIPYVGTFSVYDYAGQKQFHKTHGLFFSALNSLTILVISLLTGKERRPCTFKELINEAHYWLSFLRASLGKEFIPTVVIVASRADCCPHGQGMLQQVVNQMSDVFKGKIVIREECFLLDCRKSWSPAMKLFRRFLKEARDKYLQSGFRYPCMCEPVTSNVLPALREKQEEPFMETEELVREIEMSVIEDEEESPGQYREVINEVVNFLDETGEIIHVQSLVSLYPCWLSEYAIGPLMTPPDMGCHVEAPNGRMTRQEAERAVLQYLRKKRIKVCFNIDHILDMLVSLGVIFKLEDGTYMFPAHLPLKSLSEMWKKEADKPVYVGRRYICSSATSIFSPSTFALFQCHIGVKLDIKLDLWRDGMIVVPRAGRCFVECLVVMDDPLRAIDFVARGGKGSESDCLSLLQNVMTEWIDVVEKHSPGTEYKMTYLSKRHLTEHREQPAAYSAEDIENAKSLGPLAVVAHDRTLVEALADLLVDPEPCLTACIHDAETSGPRTNKVFQHQVEADLAAEVERKLTARQIVAIAERIAGDWETVVAYLEPELFQSNKRQEIKKKYQYDSSFIHAQEALTVWGKYYRGKATQSKVITALCKSGYRAQAVEVFQDELVNFVMPM